MFFGSQQRIEVPRRKLILIAVFSLLIIFGILKSLPQNYQHHVWWGHGNAISTVKIPYEKSDIKAQLPWNEVTDRFLFRGHNPGMFMAVTEIAIRLGLQSTFTLQLMTFLLFLAGLMFHHAWMRRLFDDFTATAGTIFLFTTPFVIFYSNGLHQYSYVFLFFNMTAYFYIRFLESSGKKRGLFLAVSLISWFLLTQNYYMFYLSTPIFVLALHVLYTKKIFAAHHLLFAAVIVFSLSLIVLQMVQIKGGMGPALSELKDNLALRTMDVRSETAKGSKHKLELWNKLMYPYNISDVVRTMFHIDGVIYIGALIWFLRRRKLPKAHVKFLLLTLTAGLSWHLIMMEHTIHHRFSGIYGFFCWTMLFALAARLTYPLLKQNETESKENLPALNNFKSRMTGKQWKIGAAVLFALPFCGYYLQFLIKYIKTLAA